MKSDICSVVSQSASFGRFIYAVAIAALAVAPCVSYARTWHSAQTAATIEGDFISQVGDNVRIQDAGGKIYTIAIANLSADDKVYLAALSGTVPAPAPAVQQAAPPAASPAAAVSSPAPAAGSLAVLIPPVSVKGSAVTGAGDAREATLTLTNTGNKSIKGYVQEIYFLTADGTVGGSAPHSNSGAFDSFENVLKPGKAYAQKVGSFFMEDDTKSVNAAIMEVTFDDDSKWPAVPAKPAQNSSAPVSAFVMGIIGTGEQAVPAVACFNHTAKDIKTISYSIQYLDAGGKVLDESGYGSMSDESILDAGKGDVICGGEPPSAGAASVNIVLSSVVFTDGSKWARE